MPGSARRYEKDVSPADLATGITEVMGATTPRCLNTSLWSWRAPSQKSLAV